MKPLLFNKQTQEEMFEHRGHSMLSVKIRQVLITPHRPVHLYRAPQLHSLRRDFAGSFSYAIYSRELHHCLRFSHYNNYYQALQISYSVSQIRLLCGCFLLEFRVGVALNF